MQKITSEDLMGALRKERDRLVEEFRVDRESDPISAAYKLCYIQEFYEAVKCLPNSEIEDLLERRDIQRMTAEQNLLDFMYGEWLGSSYSITDTISSFVKSVFSPAGRTSEFS